MLTFKPIALAWFCALTLVYGQNNSAGLRLGPINFAGYNNYVYRDRVTSAQIVISE